MDLQWYEDLPEDLKGIFDVVAEETIAYSDRLNRQAEESYIDKLEEKLQINYLDAKALAEFRELSTQVYGYYTKQGVLSDQEIRQARAIAVGVQ